MTYRSHTPLATRKNPVFGKMALKLDGISDYISLQGKDSGIFRHSLRHCTQNPPPAVTNYAPQSWLFWVKFDSATLTDVVTHTQQYGADMKHFIMKQGAAIQGFTNAGGDQDYWSAPFVGLVADGSGNVKVAAGWGRKGAQSSTNRLIRRGSTTISANTWYMITVTWEGKSQIKHGEIFVNNNQETLAAHYPTGGSTELNVNTVNSALPYFYYVLYAPEQGFAGNTYTSGELASYSQAAVTYDVCLGRNQNDFLEMTIMDCVFWGRTALDQDDVTGLYESTNPSEKQYHVNGTGLASANVNYDKGEDVHATVPHLDFSGLVAKPEGETIVLTDMQGTDYTFKFMSSPGNGGNGNVQNDGTIGVLYRGSSGSDLDNTACCTNFAQAINTNCKVGEFQLISATDNGGSISMEQGYGGANGNLAITYSGTFASDYVRAAAGAAAPTAFTGGIDRLHGVWKFRGPRISSVLDNTLQGSSNRFSEYNEDPVNTTKRIDVPTFGGGSGFLMLTDLPSETQAAINNGGLYVNDTPDATI